MLKENQIQSLNKRFPSTVKPVLSGHLKTDKTKVLMENGSLMKVESIAECSLWSILQYFDLHKAIIVIENLFFHSI